METGHEKIVAIISGAILLFIGMVRMGVGKVVIIS